MGTAALKKMGLRCDGAKDTQVIIVHVSPAAWAEHDADHGRRMNT
ncbi:hypothetical protein [Arthrobacter oryzae]|jgi:hypothetical protein|nr:hypothetical protein [Arthrobacter oryzae]MDQ0077426.1 hypothetical protein [Arthrobacter oryzae]